MVPTGNKAKRLSSVNHTTKKIHHHHHHHHLSIITIYKVVLHIKGDTKTADRNRGVFELKIKFSSIL